MKKTLIFILSIVLILGLAVGVFFLFDDEPVLEEYRVAYMGFPVKSLFWDKIGEAINRMGTEKGLVIDDYTTYSSDLEVRSVMAERLLKEDYDAVVVGFGSIGNFSLNLVQELNNKGVPIFALDTVIEDEFIEGFTTTDNYESGQIVGEYIYSKIEGDDKVLIVAANMIREHSKRRANGAKDFLIERDIKLKLIDLDNFYWDEENAANVTLEEFERNSDYSAIFVIWDEGVVAVKNRIKEIGDYEIIYVGFDGLDFALKEISEGEISATIMQSVNGMVGATFDQVVSYLNGEEYSKEIFVPGVLITKENVDEYIDK